MKAAVLRRPLQISVEDVPKPPVGSREVLVNIRATAVCGTDVGIYTGKNPVPLPLIMGHETTGEIVEIGSGVTRVHVGEAIVIDPTISCGTCYLCRMGRSNLCEAGGLMGRESQGSYAEFAAVPESRVYRLPKDISYEDGTTLVALFTVVSGQRKLPFLAGSSMAILGMGVTGLLHLQLAKLSGASPVIVTSRSPWKLDLARRFKADIIINAKEGDPIEGVKRATHGRGVDVAIESAGSVETIRQSLKMARPGGMVLQYGIAAKSMDGLDLYPLYYRELTVIGSRAFTSRDLEVALELVGAGGIDLEPFVTHRFSLEKIAEGLEFVQGHPGDVLRAVIQV